MGTVYEAESMGAGHFKKRVAVKIIREEFSTIPEFRSNFVGEAKLVANLIHANIVQIYHLGEKYGQYFMVMEYVDGFTLEDFILQHRAMKKEIPEKLACFIISRVCRGLAYAHQARDIDGNRLGIVHRDVNPRNIIISKGGDVKLMDFGIAKALQYMFNHEGHIIAGKDEYLSPEAARKEVTDPRSDIFSCGILLMELLTGENMYFVSGDPDKTRENVCNQELPNLREEPYQLDENIVEIIETALRKDRERRTQTAQLLMAALEYHLYKNGYGPTNEKLSHYTKTLFAKGFAFDRIESNPEKKTFGINAPADHVSE